MGFGCFHMPGTTYWLDYDRDFTLPVAAQDMSAKSHLMRNDGFS